jgi:hypothetical protein
MKNLVENKLQLLSLLIIPAIFLYRMIFFGEIVTTNDELERYPINEWRDSYLASNDDTPQWFPNLFSGMPSYGGYIYTNGDPTKFFRNQILLNPGMRIWFYLSLSGLGMFILLRLIGISRNAALFGSLISSLTPYTFGLINAGHLNKIFSMAYIPWVIAAFIYYIKKPSLKSILLLSLSTALQLWANHPQIAYYTWMLIGFYFVWIIGISIFEKEFNFTKFSKLFFGIITAIILSLIMVSDPYSEIYKFQKYSDRGLKSVLNNNEQMKDDKTWEYSTRWSFHPKEIISFILPYHYGLQNTSDLKKGSYWGYMPFTQSTHYLGLIALVFSILGALLKKPDKRIMVFWVITALTLITGFGSFLPILYKPFFSLLPFFSKFRVPSMIYVLLAITIPLLGAKGLDIVLELINDKKSFMKIKKLLFFALAFIILFMIFGELFTKFQTGSDSRYNPNIISQLKSARITLFTKGLILAFGLILTLLGLFIAFSYKKIKSKELISFIIILSVLDIWIVNQEFMNIKPPQDFDLAFRENKIINHLKNDTSNFRILPADEMNSNRYSFWNLESVSGYRPIKLRNYQDMMDANGLSNPNILNMLNVKYVLTRKNINNSSFVQIPEINGLYRNTNVLPKSWIVQKIKTVSTQKESLLNTLLSNFDPSEEAVVTDYKGSNLHKLGSGKVSIVERKENKIELISESETGGLLVLSEIFYEPGWKAYVNGEAVKIYQTNHILRSIDVPVGKVSVIFEYKTKNWFFMRTLSMSSFIFCLGVLGIIFWKEKKTANQLEKR